MNVFMLKLYVDVTSKVTIDLLGKSARLNHDFLLISTHSFTNYILQW